MRDRAGAAWPAGVGLRALQTCFVGPVNPGEVDIHAPCCARAATCARCRPRCISRGRWRQCCWACSAPTVRRRCAPRLPQRPAPPHEADALPAPPPRPHGAPAFLEHFDMRWAEGAVPFSGGDGCTSCIHMRLKPDEAASVSTELLTVLLADLSPTPVVGQLTTPSRQQLGHVGAGTASGAARPARGLVARRQRVARWSTAAMSTSRPGCGPRAGNSRPTATSWWRCLPEGRPADGPTMSSVHTTRHQALEWLRCRDPDDKARGVRSLDPGAEAGAAESLAEPEGIPGRPERPALVPHTRLKPAFGADTRGPRRACCTRWPTSS